MAQPFAFGFEDDSDGEEPVRSAPTTDEPAVPQQPPQLLDIRELVSRSPFAHAVEERKIPLYMGRTVGGGQVFRSWAIPRILVRNFSPGSTSPARPARP
jgi:hypothetical protein